MVKQFEFTGARGKVVILDNRDSFVFNIAHRLSELGVMSEVVRSDAIDIQKLVEAAPRALIISPGPRGPKEAGISIASIQALIGTPILGICLGHQCIVEAFGGRVVESGAPMHGRQSPIVHNEHGVFKAIPNRALFGRYHSLIAQKPLPDCLAETAWTGDENHFVMALEHRELPVYGVQFHPESVLSPFGLQLLKNFIEIVDKRA